MIARWFKYVVWQDVAAYEAIGWINCGACPGHHGAWSALMEWPFDRAPELPERGLA